MPTAPQRITLRPITAEDIAGLDSRRAAVRMDVWVRLKHAGQHFYTKGFVKHVKRQDVYEGGYYLHELPKRLEGVAPVIGQHIEVTAGDSMGHEFTTHLDTSQEVFDALYPEGGPYGTRSLMLGRAAERLIALDGNGGRDDFETVTLPVYGAEVNLRLIVADVEPEQIVAELTALLAAKGRVVRAQARPVADLRTNVYDITPDEDFKASNRLVGVNVLDAETIEYVREYGSGNVSTVAVPYGTPAPALGD